MTAPCLNKRVWKSLKILGPEAPRVAAVKKLSAPWKMSTIFREIFCGHFPWKLKDENLQKISPKFRRIFRRSLRKISQELRSGGLRAQENLTTSSDANCRCQGRPFQRSLFQQQRGWHKGVRHSLVVKAFACSKSHGAFGPKMAKRDRNEFSGPFDSGAQQVQRVGK